MKIKSVTQTACPHHEWIENTQTTASSNNLIMIRCRICGKVVFDKRLSDFVKLQWEKYKYNSNLKK